MLIHTLVQAIANTKKHVARSSKPGQSHPRVSKTSTTTCQYIDSEQANKSKKPASKQTYVTSKDYTHDIILASGSYGLVIWGANLVAAPKPTAEAWAKHRQHASGEEYPFGICVVFVAIFAMPSGVTRKSRALWHPKPQSFWASLLEFRANLAQIFVWTVKQH